MIAVLIAAVVVAFIVGAAVGSEAQFRRDECYWRARSVSRRATEPDEIGEHFRVVTVCGHYGEVWSKVAGSAGGATKP